MAPPTPKQAAAINPQNQLRVMKERKSVRIVTPIIIAPDVRGVAFDFMPKNSPKAPEAILTISHVEAKLDDSPVVHTVVV